MTRKDTILVAVLINAGLLIVLFATASKSSDSNIATKVEESTPFSAIEVPVHSEFKPDVAIDLMSANAKVEQEAHPEVRFEPREIEVLPQTQTETPVASSEAPIESVHNQPKLSEHIVQKGQVLEKIAKMHHVGVDAIMATNHLSTTQLKIGQVLKIPAQKVASTTSTPSVEIHKVAESAEAKYYVVQPGDSPWTIAVKNKIKVEDLLRLNQLDQAKAKKLKPGTKLRIQ